MTTRAGEPFEVSTLAREVNGSPGDVGEPTSWRSIDAPDQVARTAPWGGRRATHVRTTTVTRIQGSPRMTIDRVQAFAVRYPEPNNDGKTRSLCLVRIDTSDGLTGWGEAISGAQEASLATAFIVERRLAPVVLGRDPRDVAGAWTALRDATYWDGNGGIVTFGISAIDMALWDVAGEGGGRPGPSAPGRQAPGARAGVRLDHLRDR